MQDKSELLQHYVQLKNKSLAKCHNSEAEYNDKLLLAEEFRQLFFKYSEYKLFEMASKCIDDALGCLAPILVYKKNKSFSSAYGLAFKLCNDEYDMLFNHQFAHASQHGFNLEAHNKALNKAILRIENLTKLDPILASTALITPAIQNRNKIINIQSVIRGNQLREKYQINHLPPETLEDYPAFVVGNDPEMPNDLDNYIQIGEKIALIATSGMRAIALACKLGNANQLPKIILVDNSYQVTSFWQKIREFIRDDRKAATEELFFVNLNEFLSCNYSLYRDLDVGVSICNDKVAYPSQNIFKYFKELFDKYNYDFVKKVILHTSVIKQSWGDIDTFKKIKNIIDYLEINKIFMYPSNIIGNFQDSCRLKQGRFALLEA